MYNKDQERSLYDESKNVLAGATTGQIAPNALHQQLVRLINYHEWRYYVQNDPVLSDFEYDQLFKKIGGNRITTACTNQCHITYPAGLIRFNDRIHDGKAPITHVIFGQLL